MGLMGYREYARHRGCSLGAVQKALAAKRIESVLDGRGRKMIDAAAADVAWLRNTDPAKQSLLYGGADAARRVLAGGAPGPAGGALRPHDLAAGTTDLDARLELPPDADLDSPLGAPATAPSASDEDNDKYRLHRAEREQTRSERERMELEQLKGSLIELEDARRLAFTAFRNLRDAILNVPARIKDQCAAESDAFVVEQIIDAELSAALSNFEPARVTLEADDDDAT